MSLNFFPSLIQHAVMSSVIKTCPYGEPPFVEQMIPGQRIKIIKADLSSSSFSFKSSSCIGKQVKRISGICTFIYVATSNFSLLQLSIYIHSNLMLGSLYLFSSMKDLTWPFRLQCHYKVIISEISHYNLIASKQCQGAGQE